MTADETDSSTLQHIGCSRNTGDDESHPDGFEGPSDLPCPHRTPASCHPGRDHHGDQAADGTSRRQSLPGTASIQHADCILVLEDGLLVGKGTHQELLKSCDVYKEIVSSQLSKEDMEK